MNKVKLFFVCVVAFMLTGASVFAQVPNLLNYQGVALNSNGQPIANSSIHIRVGVAQLNGAFQYREQRLVTTDAMGHFAFQIGSAGATNVLGSVNSILWNLPGQMLHVYMDASGGTNFTLLGSDTLTSVPYSFMAKNALTADNATTANNATTATYSDTLILPYQRDDNSVNSFVVNNENTSILSNAIVGRTFGGNTNNVGVLGEVGLTALNGTGVRGRSYTSGSIAVEGISTSGTAVRAKSGSTGTALVAENTNTTGKALDVNGNLKIAGGNTSPGAGKILTSDASGNASWQAPHKVAYKAAINGVQTISHNTWVTPPTIEVFDVSGNYNPNSAATDANTFIVPVSGYYQLYAYAYIFYSSNVNNITVLQFRYTVNGIPTSPRTMGASDNSQTTSSNSGNYTELIHLNAGDKVKLQLYQTNDGNDPVDLSFFDYWGTLQLAD
ncbi:MAG: hypothetical protein JNM44_11255 [Chitinophagaceae bacterium]|nr:hypothetical protein [Chitinophagaceae bacterium]